MSRPHRVHAIEVVSNTTLPVHEFSGGYRVDPPDFPFTALLVVAAPYATTSVL